MTAAITQPRALQMYQLLDNMEIEESKSITEESAALLSEHQGLLDDLYKTMQDALLLRLRHLSQGSIDPRAAGEERDGGARGDREELAELDEEKEALQGQLAQNTERIRKLIEELPTRIISVERLQILRLTLQNIALHVERRERELQMQTVRRVLTHSGGTGGVGVGVGGRGDDAGDETRVLPDSSVRELLSACSANYGGGDQLLELAGGDVARTAGDDAAADGDAADGDAADAADGGGGPAGAGGALSRGATQRKATTSRSPHLSLAAVVPTLIEVQDSEDRHRLQNDSDESRLRQGTISPSLLQRQKSIGEFVREAAAFSTQRSESSTTRHRRDPTSEPPPGTPLMRATLRARRRMNMMGLEEDGAPPDDEAGEEEEEEEEAVAAADQAEEEWPRDARVYVSEAGGDADGDTRGTSAPTAAEESVVAAPADAPSTAPPAALAPADTVAVAAAAASVADKEGLRGGAVDSSVKQLAVVRQPPIACATARDRTRGRGRRRARRRAAVAPPAPRPPSRRPWPRSPRRPHLARPRRARSGGQSRSRRRAAAAARRPRRPLRRQPSACRRRTSPQARPCRRPCR